MTLHQGLIVHADGRFVADLELADGVVRALRLPAVTPAADPALELTGRIVFPGPIVVHRPAGAGSVTGTAAGVQEPGATGGGVVLPQLAPAARPARPPAGAVDAVAVPVLHRPMRQLEALPEAVFGSGRAAFAVDDAGVAACGRRSGGLDLLCRLLAECGATLLVLSDRQATMTRVAAAGAAAPACRVLLAPARGPGVESAVAVTARATGAGTSRATGAAAGAAAGRGPAVAAPWEVLGRWWHAVRSGSIQAVSIAGAAAPPSLLAELWWQGVASGCITLEQLAALLGWHPARLLGLAGKGRLYPGYDADLAVLDPEARVGERRGLVTRLLRRGADAHRQAGRWIDAVAVPEPRPAAAVSPAAGA